MADRLTALRAALDGAGLDAIFVSSPVDDVHRHHSQNRRYLTGFTGSTGYALVTRDAAWLAVDGRYAQQARDEAGPRGFNIFDTRGPQDRWMPVFLHEAGATGRRLGISTADWSYEAFLRLARIIDDMPHTERPELVPAPPIIQRLRAHKDPQEIATIERAIGIALAAFGEVRPTLAPGVTELEVADALESAMKRRGARGHAFEPIVAFGERGAMPHARLSDRPLREGEPVIIDWGAEVDGYCSDLTRSFLIGAEPPRFREIYDIVALAQRTAIERVEAGMTGAQAHALAAGVIAAAGYGDHFTHGLGHGVGLDVHDYPPYLGPSSEDILEEGMVFTIEPGIYVPGWGGVRIEDIVVLEEGGRARSLSARSAPAGA
ncbi:MAG: Xaa-Pro peptidase family protein [Dehalococcoidia bacterium]